MVKQVELEDGTFIEGVDEIPAESKIFDNEQVEYVCALSANILLNDVKGQLLNIVEGIGMPERQERAIKRSVTNVLHETVHHISECMELVEKKEPVTWGDLEHLDINGIKDATQFVKNLKKLSE